MLKSMSVIATSCLIFSQRIVNLRAGSSAIRWCFYSIKNGLSVQINPALAGAYDLPPGKQTLISAQLRRETER